MMRGVKSIFGSATDRSDSESGNRTAVTPVHEKHQALCPKLGHQIKSSFCEENNEYTVQET